MRGAGRLERAVLRHQGRQLGPARLGRRACVRADQPSPRCDVGGVDQPRHRHFHEGRVANVAVAVGVHDAARLGEQEPGLRVVGPERRDVGPLEQHHQLDEANAARWRRRDAEKVYPVGAAYRLALDGLVGGEVGHGHRSGKWCLAGPGDDPGPGRPRVKRRRPLRGEPPQEVGIGLVGQPVAGVEQRAVGLREISDDVRRVVFRPIGVDHLFEPRADDEALVRGPFRVAEQGAPRQLAVLLMGEAEHPDRARNAGRPPAQQRDVERQRLARRIEEHARGRLRRGDFAAVVDGELAGARVEIIHEGAAPDARALRLDEAEHRLDGDRRVDRVAAALEDIEAGLCRERVGGDDERLRRLRLDRRFPGRRRGAGKQRCAGERAQELGEAHGEGA